MDLGIAGRRAFVAGSTTAMGAEIAKHLAAECVEVVHGAMLHPLKPSSAQSGKGRLG